MNGVVWAVAAGIALLAVAPTAAGAETVLNTGIATDPVTGLTADLAAVFS